MSLTCPFLNSTIMLRSLPHPIIRLQFLSDLNPSIRCVQIICSSVHCHYWGMVMPSMQSMLDGKEHTIGGLQLPTHQVQDSNLQSADYIIQRFSQLGQAVTPCLICWLCSLWTTYLDSKESSTETCALNVIVKSWMTEPAQKCIERVI